MNTIGLVGKLSVKLLRKEMCAFAYDESTIIRAIGEKVDKTLETSEAGRVGVLVLMSPRLVCGKISTVGEAEVDSIKRDTKNY
jgi:hypothetical protein